MLKHHLQHCKKIASYLSPQIQNELIRHAGEEVRRKIIDAAKVAKWYSVMVDECADVAALEQMAICIRFVDESSPKVEVREEFLGFVELEKADAKSISAAIIKFLEECDLSLVFLRGQGYDGASVMSGKVTGVRTQIQQVQPKALYQHCRSHILNLVVSSSCSQVQEIRNLFDSVGKLTWFLGASAKRKAILKRYLASDDISNLLVDEEDDNDLSEKLIRSSCEKSVPRLCTTRWTSRVVTLSSVIAKYKAIYSALGDIASESSDADARNNAQSYMKLMASSSFIVALVVAQRILSISHPLSLALQKTQCDVHKAYCDAKVCRDTILLQRQESKFETLWPKVELLASSIGTTLSKPRTACRSIYRSNAGCEQDVCEADSLIGYYRRNVFSLSSTTA